jgi:CDP-4-dehydro-6-deoxyglucose reductase
MAHYVTVSKAARLLGMNRARLQECIRDSRLDTFEGMVDVDELRRAYPTARLQNDTMLEQVERYKDNAVGKYAQQLPDSEYLLRQAAGLHNELQRAYRVNTELAETLETTRVALEQSQQQSAGYLEVVVELKDRMLEMQEKCDQRQQIMLETLLSWLIQRVDEKQRGS